MIRYALRCADGHRFESWFQTADAYDALAARGLLSCAVCGGGAVDKALMAPPVSVRSGSVADGSGSGAVSPAGLATGSGAGPAVGAAEAAAAPARPLSEPGHPAEQMLRALREHIERQSTYVGGRFAREARAMHLGEVPERPIHGEARPEEARALIEEGVPILPLPIPVGPRRN